jgi:hypothetical protein
MYLEIVIALHVQVIENQISDAWYHLMNGGEGRGSFPGEKDYIKLF